MKRFNKIIRVFSRSLGLIATGLILPMMLATVADVTARFVFNKPLIGVGELEGLMMAAYILAMAWCATENRHVVVVEIVKRFPNRVQLAIDVIAFLAGLALSAVISWRTVVATTIYFHNHTLVSIVWPYPVYPFYAIFALSWITFSFVVLAILIQRVVQLIKGEIIIRQSEEGL